MVFTPTELDTSGCSAQVEVVRLDPGAADPDHRMRRLTSDFGVRLLLCEGGPTLFGALLREDLVDELFLTLSPKLAGGGSEAPITHGPPLLGAPPSHAPVGARARGLAVPALRDSLRPKLTAITRRFTEPTRRG